MDLTPFVDAGLLDPAAAGADDTIAMLEYLAGLGIETDQLIEEFRNGDIHAAGTAGVLRDGELTAAEVAARVGVPADQVVEVYRLLGVDLADIDARRIRLDEVDSMRQVLAATQNFEDGEADEILRAASAALTHVAEAIVSVFVGGIEERTADVAHVSDLERTQITQVMAETGVEFGMTIGKLFRHHLWAAVERQRASMTDVPDRRMRTMTVGFVDLVGFTPLSAQMSSTELVGFVRQFEARSYDIATRSGGRIVKTIGDEVMISALTSDAGATIVLDLIDEFGAGGTAPRGGLASGALVSRQGDYFGPVVNLASRLVDEAVPGEVLADVATGEAATGFACEPAGRRMLKGFADPVGVVSISRR